MCQTVRELLQQSGVDPKNYAGHSFRIGAATTANRQGISETTIKTLGRWESSAYLRYIKLQEDSYLVFHLDCAASLNYYCVNGGLVLSLQCRECA